MNASNSRPIPGIIPGILAGAGILALAIGLTLTATAAGTGQAVEVAPRVHGEPCTVHLTGNAEDPSAFIQVLSTGLRLGLPGHTHVPVCPGTLHVDDIDVELDPALGRWSGEIRSASGDVAEWYFVNDEAATQTTVTATVLDETTRILVDTQPMQ